MVRDYKEQSDTKYFTYLEVTTWGLVSIHSKSSVLIILRAHLDLDCIICAIELDVNIKVS